MPANTDEQLHLAIENGKFDEADACLKQGASLDPIIDGLLTALRPPVNSLLFNRCLDLVEKHHPEEFAAKNSEVNICIKLAWYSFNLASLFYKDSTGAEPAAEEEKNLLKSGILSHTRVKQLFSQLIVDQILTEELDPLQAENPKIRFLTENKRFVKELDLTLNTISKEKFIAFLTKLVSTCPEIEYLNFSGNH